MKNCRFHLLLPVLLFYIFTAIRVDADTTSLFSPSFSPYLYYSAPNLSIIAHAASQSNTSEGNTDWVLTVQVSNNGPGAAFDVTCFLNNDTDYCIHDGNAHIGKIPPGESRQATLTFTDQISSAADDTFAVAITERYGYFPDIVKVLPSGRQTTHDGFTATTEQNPYRLLFSEHSQSKRVCTTRAILIGNRLYHALSLPKREYAIRDVRSFKDFLLQSCNCMENTILEFCNIDLNEMNLIFNTPDSLSYHLGSPARTDDLLVYFNGYGFITGEDRALYLAPIDCPYNSKEIPLHGFRLTKLYKLLGQLNLRRITLILDVTVLDPTGDTVACDFSTFSEYIPHGTLIVSNATTGQTYPHEESQHSLLTYSLLKGMSDELSNGAAYISHVDISRLLTSSPFSVPALESIRFRGGSSMPVIIGEPNEIVLSLE